MPFKTKFEIFFIFLNLTQKISQIMYFCGTQDRLLQILRKTKNIQLFILVKIKQRDEIGIKKYWFQEEGA